MHHIHNALINYSNGNDDVGDQSSSELSQTITMLGKTVYHGHLEDILYPQDN